MEASNPRVPPRLSVDDFKLTGSPMANIRTANKRHNRAITLSNARRKVAAAPASPSAKPKKTSR